MARGGNTAGGRIFFLRPSPFCVTQGFPSRTQKDIDMDLSIDAQWKTSFSRNPRLSHDTIFTFGDVEHVGHVKVGHTKTKRKKHVTKDGDNVHEAKKRRYIKILKEIRIISLSIVSVIWLWTKFCLFEEDLERPAPIHRTLSENPSIQNVKRRAKQPLYCDFTLKGDKSEMSFRSFLTLLFIFFCRQDAHVAPSDDRPKYFVRSFEDDFPFRSTWFNLGWRSYIFHSIFIYRVANDVGVTEFHGRCGLENWLFRKHPFSIWTPCAIRNRVFFFLIFTNT